jgi:coproporphyrinogen III oxidase
MDEKNLRRVTDFLQQLQSEIIASLSSQDSQLTHREDAWSRAEGGGGRTYLLENGSHIEKAGINYSDVYGTALPQSASAQRPELSQSPFQACGVSVVIHPKNPYIPTSHMNVRFFCAQPKHRDAIWWFGGGFDLTPYYGFKEDAIHWHRTAQSACATFGEALYPKLKAQCDRYFFLPHRNEARGIGGLFFDDFNQGGFENAFQLMQSVGQHYMPAYLPIFDRRKMHPYGEHELNFQQYRRGRYVEFNLLYDRGTLFGLQSKGRTESILMSLPPMVRWDYSRHFDPQSAEAELVENYLKPQDWLQDDS